MDYKIIVDSGTDQNNVVFPAEHGIKRVPLWINIDGLELRDIKDSIFEKLKSVEFRARSIKTACPSPDDFFNALNGVKKAFVITLSSALSGSHASAEMARNMIREQDPESDIFVVDTQSASVGQSMVLYTLLQMMKENLPANSVAEKLREYVAGMKTMFVLESLDTLVSNGRVSAIKDMAIKALKIYPIMGDDGHGRIEVKSLGRGKQRAFSRLIEMIGDSTKDFRETVLGISHCDALERAMELKERIQERYHFKEVLVFECGGVSSVYAGKGGIVVAY